MRIFKQEAKTSSFASWGSFYVFTELICVRVSILQSSESRANGLGWREFAAALAKLFFLPRSFVNFMVSALYQQMI
jgi:hypothetical protein